MDNVFVRNAEDYQRDLDVLNAYYHDMAHGLARMKGISHEQALQWVKEQTQEGGALAFEDPPMKFVGRQENGDRELKQTTFLKYLGAVSKNDLIISPSMTVYKNKHMRRSISAAYIEVNIKRRSASKKEMFQYRQKGNMPMFEYKKNEQNTFKIKNNALSGTHCSDSTVLFYDTIHSSLTSTCRSASGYGNALNERLIAGNRHYWSPDIAIANILSLCRQVDLEKLAAAMTEFQLHYPSTDDVMKMVTRCTEHYWINPKQMTNIERLVDSLEPIEKAAVLYTGDFYHIAQYNDQFTRSFIGRLSTVPDGPVDNPKELVEALPEEGQILVSLLCSPYLVGTTIESLDSFNEDGSPVVSPEAQQIIGATAANVATTLKDYETFIKAVFVTDAMPPTVANLPSIMRYAAITSDTDSTIYTTQWWLAWWNGGELDFSQETARIGHVISFLSSASIVHILATMSANIGVATDQIFQYTMKSEFYFPVFSLTSRGKVYYASIMAQEGEVFKNMDRETKGAVFHGSNLPNEIVEDVENIRNNILDTINRGEQIELVPLLQHIANRERIIHDHILSGQVSYYMGAEIKPADSYKLGPDKSPYLHYLLWEEVFAKKYGHIEEPPYQAVKITLNLENKTDWRRWITSMDDPMIAQGIQDFVAKYNKASLGTIYIPKEHAREHGVPPEILSAVSVRDIVANLTEPYYVVLESLGYYTIDDKRTRLIMDRY